MSGIAVVIRGRWAAMKVAMAIAAILVSGCDETPGTPAIRDVALAEARAFCAAYLDSPECKILQFLACEEDSYPAKCYSKENEEDGTRVLDLEHLLEKSGLRRISFRKRVIITPNHLTGDRERLEWFRAGDMWIETVVSSCEREIKGCIEKMSKHSELFTLTDTGQGWKVTDRSFNNRGTVPPRVKIFDVDSRTLDFGCVCTGLRRRCEMDRAASAFVFRNSTEKYGPETRLCSMRRDRDGLHVSFSYRVESDVPVEKSVWGRPDWELPTEARDVRYLFLRVWLRPLEPGRRLGDDWESIFGFMFRVGSVWRFEEILESY